jgi:hypothetical protein
MKIAICISGLIRSYDRGIQSIRKNIINQFPEDQIDIFVSTWQDQQFNDFSNIKDISFAPKLLNKFIDFYENKRLAFYENQVAAGIRTYNVLSMFYQIMNCNLLKIKYEKITNKKYDLVFRLRTDFLGHYPINFNMQNLKKNNIYIDNPSGSGFGDGFAFGDSESMDIYSNAYLYIDDFISTNQLLRPEDFLKWYITKNISHEFIGYSWDIIR